MLRLVALRISLFAVPFALASTTSMVVGQTVFDAPPTAIPDNFSLDSGDVLNVAEGGLVGTQLRANDGSIVNVEGGTIGLGFRANSGSKVIVSGGNVGAVDNALIDSFSSLPGSSLTVSGGTLGDGAEIGGTGAFSGGSVGRQFRAVQGSTVAFTGADFKLNGVPFSEAAITIDRFTDPNAVFSGTFADGTAFIYSPLGYNRGDELHSVTLTSVPVSAADLTPRVIASDATGSVAGMRSGQLFAVKLGGRLPRNFSVVEATLSIEGGDVGRNLEVTGGAVNISGGSIGDYFYAYPGSTVDINGGSVGFRLEAFASEVNITGGEVGNNFIAHPGSIVKVSGGRVGNMVASAGTVTHISGGRVGTGNNLNFSLLAESGSKVQVTGGGLGQAFAARAGSTVELVGGEFQLNGAAFIGSQITLGAGDIFTGTLGDGSPFVFSPLTGDDLHGVALTPAALPAIDLSPSVVDSPQTDIPSGLRTGQALTVVAGGVLPVNFAVVNATLNVAGGVVGGGVKISNGTVNLTGGILGGRSSISSLAVNSFSSGVDIIDSVVNMSGGFLGERSSVRRGGVLSVTGGSIGTKFNAFEGSQVTLAGGSVGPDFQTLEGSHVELLGADFKLNGQDYFENEITLDVRGGALDVFSGILSDGSPFIFSPEANPLGDELRAVKVTRTPLPVADHTPKVLATPLQEEPNGLRPGQTMTVVEGGALPDNFTAIGATLNVTGGRVGSFAEVLNSTVRISGGEVDSWFQAHNSEVEIIGGKVGAQFSAFPGTRVTIDGASVGGLRVYKNASAEIRGGAEIESSVQVLSGELTLVDGHIRGGLSGAGKLSILGGTIEQTFQIDSGEAEISGGSFGGLFFVNNSVVTIKDGSFDGRLLSYYPSRIDIEDGAFSRDVWNRRGTINIAGGVFADDIVNGDGASNGLAGTISIAEGTFLGDLVNSSGTAHITGGDFAGDILNGSAYAREVSTLNISGGSFDGTFTALKGSVVNIFGSAFYLDGVLLTGLTPYDAFVVHERERTLSGTLADGSLFSFDLNPTGGSGLDLFSADARLTVTLVPEPSMALLAAFAGCLLLFSSARARGQRLTAYGNDT